MMEAKLSKEAMNELQARLDALTAAGVKATETLSGELNMSGCASNNCMAWD